MEINSIISNFIWSKIVSIRLESDMMIIKTDAKLSDSLIRWNVVVKAKGDGYRMIDKRKYYVYVQDGVIIDIVRLI